jgi:hypothetical protein
MSCSPGSGVGWCAVIRLHGSTPGGVLEMECETVEQAERVMEYLNAVSKEEIEWTLEQV